MNLVKKYNFSKIERKWQRIWQKYSFYDPDLKKAKKPFYNLMMFPYPSAEGLHVGNMYAFVGSDIYGRFKRMQGYDVFEPIGLDGFGIHSENYALKIGVHPKKQAKISQRRFYKQLMMIGNSFAWSKKLETYEPYYYKWTQWLFLQMFKSGLVYRKKAPVNWCPSCQTVLADEQVIKGYCERCSALVQQKELDQWFFKITLYAERLLKNLEKIDWSEKVKIAQKNWIGKSAGALIDFKIKDSPFVFQVFTTRPETIFGVTFLVISPEHEFLNLLKDKILNYSDLEKYLLSLKSKKAEKETEKNKTGIELKGIRVINPANKKEIPVFVSDYVLKEVGTGAVMGVPAHDQRDFEFAKKYHLAITPVISLKENEQDFVLEKAYEGEGYLINSGQFNGLFSSEAKEKIISFVKGQKKVSYHLRDWLISRQRYWGPPIPLIFCEKCKNRIELLKKQGLIKELKKEFSLGEIENPGWLAVPEKDLPVKLPFIKEFRPTGTGVSPLALSKRFYQVKCPRCYHLAKRETDVSDTFLDSSWYYLGYLGRKGINLKVFDKSFKEIAKKWLPVNMYIGGAEHAVLHLLYVRFIAMVLKDLGYLSFEEPFPKFRAHGLLIKEGAKMSKSKGNVVNPDEYIKKFGADALRLYLMFLAPFEQGGDFRDSGILGIVRFLDRVWLFYQKLFKLFKNQNKDFLKKIKDDLKLKKMMHKTIKKVTEDIEALRYNTAISYLMILFNELEKQEDYDLEVIKNFLKLLAPFAPYFTEELWQSLKEVDLKKKNGRSNTFISIHQEKWPVYDEKFIKEDLITFLIQLNGKLKLKIEVKKGLSQKEIEKIVFNQEKIKNLIKGQEIKKIIFIKDRLLNIVLL